MCVSLPDNPRVAAAKDGGDAGHDGSVLDQQGLCGMAKVMETGRADDSLRPQRLATVEELSLLKVLDNFVRDSLS